jgi:p-aminobenzoyl-glutamate transporter AbgT
LISGVILMVLWIAFGLDLGPGAPMSYTLPG